SGFTHGPSCPVTGLSTSLRPGSKSTPNLEWTAPSERMPWCKCLNSAKMSRWYSKIRKLPASRFERSCQNKETAKMNLKTRVCAPLLVVLAAASAVFAADPPKVATENDIVYTKANGSELKLDIARPAEGEGPFPVVFVIHGGAWRAGNKNDNR